ncbi:MAG: cobalt-precorrin-6A reductase [Propionibacteriaceae bacterium]
MTVLILAGTTRGRRVAELLFDQQIPAIACLAGRTKATVHLPGVVRSGGFGGAEGLAAFCTESHISAIIDATHPFAAQMTTNAVAAAELTGIPLLRCAAPSWHDHPDSAAWTWANSHAEACDTASSMDGRLVLTVGRQELAQYLPLAEHAVTARVIDAPDFEIPQTWSLITDRGPFTLANEQSLLASATALISKDSGGVKLDAKLIAAHELGIDVIMVERPWTPPLKIEVDDPRDACAWAQHIIS